MRKAQRCLMLARFQPFHYGHLNAIEYCLNKYDEAIIVIGMASQSHTPENPFTAGERVTMIRESLKWRGHDLSRIITITLPTLEVSKVSVHYVKLYSPEFSCVITLNPIIRQIFVEEGYNIDIPPEINRDKYKGSVIRKMIAEDDPEWKNLVPPPVAEFIEHINGVNRIKSLYREKIPGYYVTA
ncbi:MAG: nicotinamide-nucleotide adenylyltransferase [Desulfurococcaceae archaeon]